jgi:hypothetical protein
LHSFIQQLHFAQKETTFSLFLTHFENQQAFLSQQQKQRQEKKIKIKIKYIIKNN